MAEHPDVSTRDWRHHTADVLDLVADMLEGLTPEQWESPSLDAGWRVKDAAGHIVWRVGSSTAQMLKSGSQAYLGKHANPMKAIHDVSIQTAHSSYNDLIRDVRMSAMAHRAGLGRKNIGELGEAVVHGYDMANALGIDLGVSAQSTEAVARGRAKFASKNVRAVLKHRTLVASDAGWRVGRGAPVYGTAEAIVLFLYGRKALPPTPEHPSGP